MTGLIRPTLGPVPRTVAIASVLNGNPEILDDGATIARRTIQLPDPFEDMGGMIVRHLAWRVHETAGDGTATAAVIATALMAEAIRVIEAGANPIGVRRGVEEGLEVAAAELQRQARPIELPDEIARVVQGSLGGPKLAEMIGEIVDSVGQDGAVLVESAYGPETSYQYVEGVRWDEGWLSPSFLGTDGTTARLLEPRILITDMEIEKPEQLLPALEVCLAAGEKNLFVIAPAINDAALSMLLVNKERGTLDSIAVRSPSTGNQRIGILDDLAVWTGGRCFHREAGDSLADVTLADLGKARQTWARPYSFGLLGGHGRREAIRARMAECRTELANIKDDDWTRNKVRERIGKLAGSAAMIMVGAATEAARDELKVRVEAAVTTARAAVRDGVVPGGGAALLACAAAVVDGQAGKRDDESIGRRALARALAEPMIAIAANAGLDGRSIAAQGRELVPAQTYDVVRRAWVDPWEAGLLDSVAVLTAAMETGVSAAATTLTSGALIHRAEPEMSFSP
jgi:chaperonin GroEL